MFVLKRPWIVSVLELLDGLGYLGDGGDGLVPDHPGPGPGVVAAAHPGELTQHLLLEAWVNILQNAPAGGSHSKDFWLN